MVVEKARTFQEGTSFLAWVLRIARLKVLKTCRAKRNQGLFLSEEVVASLCAAAPPEGSGDLAQSKLQALDFCLERFGAACQEHRRLALPPAHRRARSPAPDVDGRVGPRGAVESPHHAARLCPAAAGRIRRVLIWDPTRLQLLLNRYVDGLLNSAEKTELEMMLLRSPEARALFWEHADWNALLREHGEQSWGRELAQDERLPGHSALPLRYRFQRN